MTPLGRNEEGPRPDTTLVKRKTSTSWECESRVQ